MSMEYVLWQNDYCFDCIEDVQTEMNGSQAELTFLCNDSYHQAWLAVGWEPFPSATVAVRFCGSYTTVAAIAYTTRIDIILQPPPHDPCVHITELNGLLFLHVENRIYRKYYTNDSKVLYSQNCYNNKIIWSKDVVLVALSI